MEPQKPKDGLEKYNQFAETVGMVPSLRKQDNLIQGAVVGLGTVVSAAVGWFSAGSSGALVGALAGLVGFGLLSGFALMLVGIVRARKG